MNKKIEFEATGTFWEIAFFDEKYPENILETVLNKVKSLELVFSRFNQNSELSLLNQAKSLQNPSKELWYVLETSLIAAEISDHKYTPLIGKKLIEKGYGANFETNQAIQQKNELRVFTKESIQILPDDFLDLGSLAKGYIIDQVSEELQKIGLKYYIINAGGDIYCTSNHGENFDIYIENPETQKIEETLSAKNSAIASSANNKRVWLHNNKQEFHIITNEESLIKGTTVAHSNAMIADMLSTLIFVTGEKYILQLKKTFGDFLYRIV